MTDKVKELLNVRGKEYGDRFVNLECIAELKDVFHRYRAKSEPALEAMLTTAAVKEKAYLHAMEMVLVKIGRICTGVYKDDNFDDAIGYLELARDMRKGKIHGEAR